MAKPTESAASAQLKKSLQILKRKGLYTPKNARAQPTRYAIELTKKYADVIKGKATVVTAPTRAAAKEQSEIFRTRGTKIVVPQSAFSKRARYSAKEGGVVQYASTETKSYSLRPMKVKDGEIPALKKNQVYSVPFRKGDGKIEFVNAQSIEELMALINDYQNRQKNAYKDMLKFVSIGTVKRRGGKRVLRPEEIDNEDGDE